MSYKKWKEKKVGNFFNLNKKLVKGLPNTEI